RGARKSPIKDYEGVPAPAQRAGTGTPKKIMSFLTPLALLSALIIGPIIVAMYLLKLRREDRRVSSTFLWQRIVRDVEANALWQKLRRTLLLLLQLLLLALLALALARPFFRTAGIAGRNLIVIIDRSASMQATDVAPSRLEA